MAFPYKHIFAALDGSTTQEAVAKRALSLAAASGAALTFGHVVDSVASDVNGADFEALCAEVSKQLEGDLADVLQKAREDEHIPSCELDRKSVV